MPMAAWCHTADKPRIMGIARRAGKPVPSDERGYGYWLTRRAPGRVGG